jgi:hypothetical protein
MKRPTKALLSLLFLCKIATAQKDNAAECDCFKTNGSSSAYFLYHQFFDYRNIGTSLASTPAVLQSASETTNASDTSDYFSKAAWTQNWQAATWDNSDSLGTSGSDASALMLNSKNNVYITSETNSNEGYTTLLTLRTARTKGFQSAGEMDSVEQNFEYISVRYLARVHGNPGGCAGLFTYRCPGSVCTSTSTTVEEADIEILTRDPSNAVQYTNQPSQSSSGTTLTAATRNVTLLAGTWSDWNEYRYDWTPGLSTWYVNGTESANISFQAPKDPTGLILNMWSDGGSWTGNMSVGAASYLQIQWIDFVYNTSGPFAGASQVRRDESKLFEKRGSGCKSVCSIEGNPTRGAPVLVSTSAGTSRGIERQTSMMILTVMFMLLTVCCI